MNKHLYIGAMSGTSLDGVDAVLTDLAVPQAPRLLGSVHLDFDSTLRQRILDLCQGQRVTLSEVGVVDIGVAFAYVEAVHRLLQVSGVEASAVKAIGAHGQTVHHEPQGAVRFTWQLGDPNTLAVQTGIAVVSDFRRRDMALGGQGAPLAPGFHELVLRHPDRIRVVLNCGGIANISVLVPGQPCAGYDTGPANMLVDAWIQTCRALPFDADGAWAAQGQVDAPLLAAFLADPYFALSAPKSTGREHFNMAWLENHLAARQAVSASMQPPSDVDVQATLLELTARSITDEVHKVMDAQQVRPQAVGCDLLVCGGGAFNTTLMRRLTALLPRWQVASTASQGIPPESMEALAFAVFAQRTVAGLPANLPSVTGASRPCVLGAVYLP